MKIRNYMPLVVILTLVINSLVAILFFMPPYQGLVHMDLTMLPMVNAILNSFTFVFLLAAYAAIRKKQIQTHRRYIYAAFGSTTLFLLTYVTYHFLTESTRYGGEGPLRTVYLFILLTHIILAIVIVPLALMSAFSGLGMQVERHRKIARWTMPIWLYVSFTGVVVYLMIRPYY
jgi:putative membrane protein